MSLVGRLNARALLLKGSTLALSGLLFLNVNATVAHAEGFDELISEQRSSVTEFPERSKDVEQCLMVATTLSNINGLYHRLDAKGFDNIKQSFAYRSNGGYLIYWGLINAYLNDEGRKALGLSDSELLAMVRDYIIFDDDTVGQSMQRDCVTKYQAFELYEDSAYMQKLEAKLKTYAQDSDKGWALFNPLLNEEDPKFNPKGDLQM